MRGAVPAAPAFDALQQRIDYFRGTVPDPARLAPLTQVIEYERGKLLDPPNLAPLTQTIDLEYGTLPAVPDLQPATAQLPAPVATAAPLSPQIVVDMTGVTLFGDPASEARKIGSQIYLREGMLVARERGF